jgi:hypothetical protein
MLHFLAQPVLMNIDMAQLCLQLNRLFCGYLDRLEVVIVYLRHLLCVKFDVFEEASPSDDLSSRY